MEVILPCENYCALNSLGLFVGLINNVIPINQLPPPSLSCEITFGAMSDTHRLLTREHLVTNTNENDLTADDEITEPVPDVSGDSGQRLHRAQGAGHQDQEGIQVREETVRGEDPGDCPTIFCS